YTEQQDERLARDLGADAFILKPAEPDAFMAQVSEVLARKRVSARLPRTPTADEQATLKLYNEVLIRKLEQKSAQLERRLVELTESQARIERLNRLYLALSETNQAIVKLHERTALFEAVCRIAVE